MRLPIIPAPKEAICNGERIDARALFGSFVLSSPEEDPRLGFHLKRIGISYASAVMEAGLWEFHSAGYDASPVIVDGNDSYYLKISKDGIAAFASTGRGLYYAITTLSKLVECYSLESLPVVEIRDFSDAAIRCDYLDLRSIHPPFDHILSNIEVISQVKLNGVVIEYEDKLPIGEPFNARNEHFSITDEMLQALKDRCWQYFIEIIPLQQSFGHLEYILKDERYSYLRETEAAVGEMCPLRSGSFEVSKALVDAMARRHPESRFLHIGCDEVWSLGQSEECREDGRSRNAIFIEYVNRIIEEVCRCGKIPLFWHDMLEDASVEELSLLDKRAIVCIWIYNGNNLVKRVRDFAWKLDAIGIRYWACPSVRAWDEDDRQDYPVLKERLRNIDYWSQCVSQLHIEGVINTNWAACFALAKPYGVYESSFFTIHYAAERCWNTAADSESFFSRYLLFFHGYDGGDALWKDGWRNEDFYQILASLDGSLERNGRIAHLVALLRQFELPTRRYFPLTVVLYRSEFFGSSDEIGSLRNKLEAVKSILAEVKPLLEEELSYYLDGYAVEQFMRSRYFVEELLIQKAEEILGIDEERE